MANAHERFFMLYLMELDQRPISTLQRAGVKTHLESCRQCQADVRLYQELRAEAGNQWARAGSPLSIEAVRQGRQRQRRVNWAMAALRAAAWTGMVVLALAAAQWVFTELLPAPGAGPAISPTATVEAAEPTPTPPAVVDGVETTVVEPLLSGQPLGGVGGWSPGSKYLFLPVQDSLVDPYADRQTISLHFIAGDTGRHCPVGETFTGKPGFMTYAWLDDERLLFIDPDGRLLLLTPCQEGYLDLGELAGERLVRVASPPIPSPAVAGRRVLLEGETAYWLLDPASLEARRLDDPAPSPGQADNFAWLPSGRQISILQPLPNEPERGRLVVLDVDSGEVLRSVEIHSTSGNGSAPLVEWMGADRPFVWGFGKSGPSLVDLSVEPLLQVYVLAEIFGLELVYPDEMNSMGAFYDADSGSYHIVVHINLEEDKSILLYHSESGQVERLAGERQAMMIFPGDQRMPLAPMLDEPSYEGGYDLIRVDAPEQPQASLQAHGHTPRSYPPLMSRLLPGSRSMLFASSQGVSRVGLPGGETLAFWRLRGAEGTIAPTLLPAPNGRALVVSANVAQDGAGKNQGELIYWIALEE